MKRILFIILGSIFITACGEVFPNPEPSPQPTYTESCSDMPERAELENAEASEYEIELACLIKNHPEQMRPTMSYHSDLGNVGRTRAEDMAKYGFYGEPNPHVDRHGHGPNYHICQTGYEADFCPVSEIRMNTVEIIAWGGHNPEQTIAAWLNSPGHRRSMLAETGLIQERIYYGAGYAYSPASIDNNGRGAHYWIFITARPPLNEGDDPEIEIEVLFYPAPFQL